MFRCRAGFVKADESCRSSLLAWLIGSTFEHLQRCRISRTVEPAVQRLGEQGLRASALEQRQRGAQLHGVDRTEDPDWVVVPERLQRRHALEIAGAEQAMVKIGTGFGERGNPVIMRSRALPEAAKLREDEPSVDAPAGASGF
jgi:hypothetical protein